MFVSSAASFSESFYGLYRVSTSMSNEFSRSDRLPFDTELASLAFLVLMPYVRDKMQYYGEKWRIEDEEGKLGKVCVINITFFF